MEVVPFLRLSEDKERGEESGLCLCSTQLSACMLGAEWGLVGLGPVSQFVHPSIHQLTDDWAWQPWQYHHPAIRQSDTPRAPTHLPRLITGWTSQHNWTSPPPFSETDLVVHSAQRTKLGGGNTDVYMYNTDLTCYTLDQQNSNVICSNFSNLLVQCAVRLHWHLPPTYGPTHLESSCKLLFPCQLGEEFLK